MSTENQTEAVASKIDVNQQVPTFAELLPESLKPYWEVIQTYPILEPFSKSFKTLEAAQKLVEEWKFEDSELALRFVRNGIAKVLLKLERDGFECSESDPLLIISVDFTDEDAEGKSGRDLSVLYFELMGRSMWFAKKSRNKINSPVWAQMCRGDSLRRKKICLVNFFVSGSSSIAT